MNNERNDALRLVAYSDDWLSRCNLYGVFVRRVIVFAVASALLAVLVDAVLALPVHNLAVSASGLIAVVNGLSYAALKRTADSAGLKMGLLMGWLAYTIWFFVLNAAGSASVPLASLHWFEAMVLGVALGAIGFASYALVQWGLTRAR
ncbi:MAG: hypothetical protein JXA10_01580 [Anaerolineae bacterium]|nr:hypothetical protein [Anaerolineae bacterium]